MKQNFGKSNCLQLFPSSSWVPESPGCPSRHWEFNLSLGVKSVTHA